MSTTATTVKVTLKNETYEIDLESLTGRERLEAKRLLEADEFHTTQLIGDEIGVLVLAYLAAKRQNPGLQFDAVLDLTGSDVTVDFSAFTDRGENTDPFAGSSPTESPSTTSSDTPSDEG